MKGKLILICNMKGDKWYGIRTQACCISSLVLYQQNYITAGNQIHLASKILYNENVK